MKAPWTSRQDEKMIKRKGEWSERRKRDYIAGCTTNVTDDDRKTDVDDDDDDVVIDDENENEGDEGCRKKREKGRKKEKKDIYDILLTQLTPPIYKTLFRDV